MKLEYKKQLVCVITEGNIDKIKKLNPSVLKQITNTRNIQDTLLFEAAQCGSKEILEWLYDHGCQITYQVIAHAASGGHLDIVKWLHEKCPSNNSYVMNFAVEANQFEVVEWLFDNDYKTDKWTMGQAACQGNLDMMKYLRYTRQCSHDMSIFNDTMMRAAIGGHIEVIKWLVKNGCHIDEYVIRYANIKIKNIISECLDKK